MDSDTLGVASDAEAVELNGETSKFETRGNVVLKAM